MSGCVAPFSFARDIFFFRWRQYILAYIHRRASLLRVTDAQSIGAMAVLVFAAASLRKDTPGLTRLLAYHRQYRQARDALRYSIHSHAWECMQSTLNMESHGLPAGVRRLRHFQQLMASGFAPPLFVKTYFTQQWDRHVIPALAASIVGGDWAQHGQGICEENGWVHVTPQVAISSPRQFGKTSGGIGRTVAAIMEAVPGRHEIVCSTSARISKLVIEVIANHLKHRGHEKRIKVSHPIEGSRIELKFDDGKISQVIGVPSNARMSIFFFSPSPPPSFVYWAVQLFAEFRVQGGATQRSKVSFPGHARSP